MNWTGGRLQRGKQGKNTVAAKQKAYFARARAKAQGSHQNVRVKLSILQDTDTDIPSTHSRNLVTRDRIENDEPQFHSRGSFETLRSRDTPNIAIARLETSRRVVEPVGAFHADKNNKASKLM